MCPDLRRRNTGSLRTRCQRGFSIVSAIFLLVVLAALGAAMVTFSTAQHTAAGQDLEAIKAYQAARAGIEWGLYQTMTPVGAPLDTVCKSAVALAGPLALGGNLSGFTVTVDCSRNDDTEGGNTVSVYQITSTATKGTVGTIQYAERQLQVTASR
jgi:MSHA biogenesis protein MshP